MRAHARTFELREQTTARALALLLMALVFALAASSATRANAQAPATSAALQDAESPTPPPAPVRDTHRFGMDFLRIDAPFGVGLGARFHPTAGLGFDVGASTTGAWVEAHGGMSFYVLSWFVQSGITPHVRVAYDYMRFTRLADRVVGAVDGGALAELAAQGTELRFEGMTLHGLSASAGLSFMTKRGGLIELSVGRYYQLGASRVRDAEDGVVVRGLRMPMVGITFGKLFGGRS